MLITSITQKGQVTIPVPIRKKLNLKPGHKLEFTEKAGKIIGEPVPDFFSFRGVLKGKRALTNREIEKIAAKEAVGRYLKTLRYR